MEQTTLDTILKVSAALTGAIIGWMAVFRPLWEAHQEKKAKKQGAIEATLDADKAYRQAVLDKLDALDRRMNVFDKDLAGLQRDNIERAYCMFVVEHGYCPSGMKESIADSFADYQARGFNHIAEKRVHELLALPEFPPNKK